MSSLVPLFLSSFIIAFSGALMPGPLLTATISESPRRGPGTGPLLILGHGILEAILLLLLLLGLAPFLQNRWIFTTIALAGSLILVWMAIGMLRSLRTLRLAPTSTESRPKSLILHGILLSLANPYWTIWWASIGFGLILQSRSVGIPGVLAFFAGHILADLLWYSLVSTLIAKSRALFSDRIYRSIIAVCAAFLLVFAGCFFYAGMGRILA